MQWKMNEFNNCQLNIPNMGKKLKVQHNLNENLIKLKQQGVE